MRFRTLHFHWWGKSYYQRYGFISKTLTNSLQKLILQSRDCLIRWRKTFSSEDIAFRILHSRKTLQNIRERLVAIITIKLIIINIAVIFNILINITFSFIIFNSIIIFSACSCYLIPRLLFPIFENNDDTKRLAKVEKTYHVLDFRLHKFQSK